MSVILVSTVVGAVSVMMRNEMSTKLWTKEHHYKDCTPDFLCRCGRQSISVEFLEDEMHKSQRFWLAGLNRFQRFVLRWIRVY